MKIKVIAFNKDIIDDVFDIQQKAYKPLFDKYQDKETNPYMESKEVVLEKYTRPGTYGYVFIENDLPVGAVRIAMKNNVCKVSALAVLPEYQNRGIAQSALREIEKYMAVQINGYWMLLCRKQEIVAYMKSLDMSESANPES